MYNAAGKLLVDIGALTECCSNHALESLSKAMSGQDGDNHDVWEPHHSLFVRRIIELFTKRGLMRLQKVQDELNAWLDGTRHHPNINAPVIRPDGMMLRWSPDDLSLVKLYLENLPKSAYTLDDWGLVIDYLVQRYLPASELRTEAEWLAARSAMMGKVQANLEKITVPEADALIAAMPLSVTQAVNEFNFTGTFKHIMDFGRLRCADLVVQLGENTRHRLKTTILEHQSAVLSGDVNATRQNLSQKLFDDFGTLNRDWRRIAVTETGENTNQGFIASLMPGARVRRVEQYKGACPFCRKIDGRVLTVVDPQQPKKDGEAQVWVGKTNIGRSSAPRKRVGDILVERQPHERWWPPAGTVHPHCRGIWIKMPDAKPTDNPAFQAWLDQHYHKLKTN